jgi:hypothetical protein
VMCKKETFSNGKPSHLSHPHITTKRIVFVTL